jgi:hypothetical protein
MAASPIVLPCYLSPGKSLCKRLFYYNDSLMLPEPTEIGNHVAIGDFGLDFQELVYFKVSASKMRVFT